MLLWVFEPIAISEYTPHFDFLFFDLLLVFLRFVDEEEGFSLGVVLQSSG
jgi:hypothetical protein